MPSTVGRLGVDGFWIGDYGGGPGKPPCWRTLKESCKGLGSVSLKINNQHTHRPGPTTVGSISHVQQIGLLSHPQDFDTPLRLAAQRKINGYRQQYPDNQYISFLPAIMSTSSPALGGLQIP